MSREPFDATPAPASSTSHFVSGNAFPETAGRPAKHSSSAARVNKHRATKARLDFTTTPRIGATVERLAQHFGCSKNEVLNSLVRFALTNRNWQQQGLWGTTTEEPTR